MDPNTAPTPVLSTWTLCPEPHHCATLHPHARLLLRRPSALGHSVSDIDAEGLWALNEKNMKLDLGLRLLIMVSPDVMLAAFDKLSKIRKYNDSLLFRFQSAYTAFRCSGPLFRRIDCICCWITEPVQEIAVWRSWRGQARKDISVFFRDSR